MPSVEYYDRDAASFGRRFDRISFTEAHADWIPFLPSAGSPVLDVGAGSGKDALALEAMGYNVTAVEPSPRLREWARRRHPSSNVVWIADSLPTLNLVHGTGRRFDFIMCSAVLMHLSVKDVGRSLHSLTELMTSPGILAISLRDRQHFEPPSIFHDADHATIRSLASHVDLDLVKFSQTLDHSRRSGVVWSSYVFQK